VDKCVVLSLGSVGVDRKAIHPVDWNGDGKCDIIVVEKATGAVDVRYMSWNPSMDTFTCSPPTKVVNGNEGCTQGWGIGQFDLGIRFADINGEKCADYMCLESDGRTTGGVSFMLVLHPDQIVWITRYVV